MNRYDCGEATRGDNESSRERRWSSLAGREIRSSEQRREYNSGEPWREIRCCTAWGPWNDAYQTFISACLGAPSNLFPFLIVFFLF